MLFFFSSKSDSFDFKLIHYLSQLYALLILFFNLHYLYAFIKCVYGGNVTVYYSIHFNVF